MLKQLLFLVLVVLGIFLTVTLIQKSTSLLSHGFFVQDFVPYFHTSQGDSKFNQGLDVYPDGVINSFDVLTDRYIQEATTSSTSANSAR